MARRVMKEFRISEISGVDFPAQGPALAAIMKRNAEAMGDNLPAPYLGKVGNLPEPVVGYAKRTFSQDQRDKAAASGAALPDGSFPVENRADLRNAVRLVGRAANSAKAKAHIISRARALGAESSLPADWQVGKLLHKALLDLTNDIAVEKFSGAIEKFIAEQETAGVENDIAVEKAREYANCLTEDVDLSVGALGVVFAEIEKDAGVTDKDGALQESFLQFKRHIQGITADGIENAVVKAALQEAGFKITEGGALAKSGDSEMGVDLKKFLNLPATATDADIQKALDDRAKTEKFGQNVLKMSADHSSYMNNEKAKMPEGGKEAFAAMSPAERDSHIGKNPCEKAKKKPAATDDDPDNEGAEDENDAEKCLKVAGQVIRKSVVGPAAFAVMKQQQEDITKLRDKDETTEIAKRVAPLTYIGKADDLAGLLHSIVKLGGNGAEIAKVVEAKFTALNEVITKSAKDGKSVFTEIGKSASTVDSGDAKTEIDTLAQKMISEGKAKNIYKARDMVRQQNPELRKREASEKVAA